ncbi:CAMK family protein kinase [Tritrichomonas foetus]|uniref:CAMK family protein kinase n=1 Tax=Tritrichomonas foetus TaxID=1144522 RepID=A0A1J4L2S8_9EUKA|nr:CAMK family protein kinase [Tritrichomonas foetus]|eukprot:OHT17400.1 CAMK family protein kinase [Tritrichomonas foetus]
MDFIIPKGYSLIQTAGTGAFSTVYKAERMQTHEIVAIKVMPKSSIISKVAQERLQRELTIHQNVIHPSIARFIDLKEDDENTYLITEFCSHGTLAELVRSRIQLPESEARKYFFQIAQGVRYLHEVAHVIHRDLKIENIMIDRDDNARIIDFGLSIEFNVNNPFIFKSCGSPKYIAPEVYFGDCYTFNIDIWALGVVLYFCVCGCFPFDDPCLKNLARKVKNEEPYYPDYLSAMLKDFLSKLLRKDPTKRIKWSQIFDHPWLVEEQLNTLYKSRSQIRKMIDERMMRRKEARQKSENDPADGNRQPSPRSSIKKRTKSNVNGMKHILAPESTSVIDRLCASGKFRRKEKKPEA